MATNEQERVQQAMRDNARGRDAAEKLLFNPRTGKIEVVRDRDPDRRGMAIDGEDLGFSTEEVCRDYPVCR